MTPVEKDRVITLRDRLARQREIALADWQFAADRARKARQDTEAAQEKWNALDLLVTAPDANLLAIAEVTHYGRS